MSRNRASWNMNKPIGRSVLCSNWRVKEDPSLVQAVEPTHEKQSSNMGAFDDSQQIPPEPVAPLRGTANENRAERAIQDGRRLYVGNLPYMAKENDVRSLFADSKYEV